MSSLSFFIDENDLHVLLDRLNADPEIAFIVPDNMAGTQGGEQDHQSSSWGPTFRFLIQSGKPELQMNSHQLQRWKAVRAVDTLKNGHHSLWHVPAGPLPLIRMDTGPRSLIGPEGPQYPPIPDPWAGWTGPPGFGPGCHAWIRLELWTRHQPAPSPSWSHDHCGGCSTRFAERPEEWNDEVHREGWVTLWPVTRTAEEEAELVAKWRAAGQTLVPAPKRSGFQLDWICPKCFEACREDLEFIVDPQHPQWHKAGI